MSLPTILAVGSAIAIVMLLARAIQAVRSETDDPRGSEPGSGHNVVEVTFTSGAGGGGDVARFRVPRDPQAYARAFVPASHALPTDKDKTDV